MEYTDLEMKNFTQIAYADFEEAFNYLHAMYPERSSFTIAELEVVARRVVSSADLGCLSCLTDEQLNTWSVSMVWDTNRETGFYACVIETSPGNAVVAFRGSEDLHDISNLIYDWGLADLGLLNSTETLQHAEVRRFLSKYKDILNQYESLTFTGHSLGGNLAEYAAIVSNEYGLDDNLERCVSFDGPGFSDEFIRAHYSQIAHMSDKMVHYRWSLVGGMLFDLPGVTYITCSVSNDANTKDDDEYGALTRHDTKYLEFDKNRKIKQGSRDFVSVITDGLSKAIDFWTGTGFFRMMFPVFYIGKVFGFSLTLFGKLVDGAATFFKNIGDAINKFFNRGNVYFKVETVRLRSDSANISSSISRVKRLVSEMFASVQGLNEMWRGPANAAFAAKFAREKEEIFAYLTRIESYTTSIENDSRAYDSCENKALSVICSLRF